MTYKTLISGRVTSVITHPDEIPCRAAINVSLSEPLKSNEVPTEFVLMSKVEYQASSLAALAKLREDHESAVKLNYDLILARKTAEEELETLNAEATRLAQEKDALAMSLAKAREEIKALQERMSEALARNATLREREDYLEQSKRELSHKLSLEIANLRSECSRLDQLAADRLNRLTQGSSEAEIVKRSAALKEENDILVKKLQAQVEVTQETEDRLRLLKAEKEAEELDAESWRAQAHRLAKVLENHDNAEAEEKLNRANDTVQRMIEAHRNEVNKVTNEYHVLADALDTLRKDHTRLTKELEERKAQYYNDGVRLDKIRAIVEEIA